MLDGFWAERGDKTMFSGSPLALQIDHRHAEAAQQLLKNTYRNVGWRTPELLSAYLAADDVYFDSVTTIRMDSWSRGRFTLLVTPLRARRCLPTAPAQSPIARTSASSPAVRDCPLRVTRHGSGAGRAASDSVCDTHSG
jgi:hypothetical protein